MQVIPHFDRHNNVWLRAVQQTDTAIADLSGRLVTGQCQLYEVWLLPENEPALSTGFLEKACFNKAEDLLHFYEVGKTRLPAHAYGKQCELLAVFATNLHMGDARFHFSVERTLLGPVISIVFGSRRAMRAVYEKGLRSLGNEVDAESST
jgi:hypothetical protein